MRTYQIEYFHHGAWNPGLIVRMQSKHLKFYLEFLNGDRPLVASVSKKITRKKQRGLPTRIRCIEPDWSQEDGYYVFDGMSLEYVNTSVQPMRKRHRT